jgi:hypothetical protein
MAEVTFAIDDQHLSEITDMVQSRLNSAPLGEEIVCKHSSARAKFSMKPGEGLVVAGQSEFWYSSGTIVRTTWRLTHDHNVIVIIWEQSFPLESTVPSFRRV